jgi:hypothetical protein
MTEGSAFAALAPAEGHVGQSDRNYRQVSSRPMAGNTRQRVISTEGPKGPSGEIYGVRSQRARCHQRRLAEAGL